MADARFVEVTGQGSATTTPDRLRGHLAAVSHAPTVAQAYEQAEGALQAMLTALREHGVADQDLRTAGIEVHSDRERRGTRGFRAAFRVETVLPDISAAGQVLSAAVEAGGDSSRVHGVSLESTTTSQALEEAREAAWADATAKAQQYAALAGRSLGAVVWVSELGGGRRGPIPFAGRDAVPATGGPIEPGTRTLRTAITVRWELGLG